MRDILADVEVHLNNNDNMKSHSPSYIECDHDWIYDSGSRTCLHCKKKEY